MPTACSSLHLDVVGEYGDRVQLPATNSASGARCDAADTERVVAGAERAPGLMPFEEVYRVQAVHVYRFCLSQVPNPTDAEDVAAEVFAAAFAAYERVRPPADRVQAWLMTIARNATVDHHRRSRRGGLLRTAIISEPGGDRTTDVESQVVVNDELRYVLGHIRRLRPKDRVLVGLRAAAGLSYAEIGTIMGMSERAATVATGRAVARLRALCGEGR